MRTPWILLFASACGTGSLEMLSDAETIGQYPVLCMEDSPAHEAFGYALCACGDLDDVGDISVASASEIAGADVGINGSLGFVGTASVAGALVVDQDVDWVGELEVRGDMTVSGAAFGVGGLTVGGTLRHGGPLEVIGDQTIAGTGSYVAPEMPPCPCELLDVAAAVAAAAEDDATTLLGPRSNVGESETTLATGSYYIESIDSVGSTRYVVDGAVSMFVGGSIDTVGSARFELAPGAQLDLYVAGDIRSIGDSGFGNPEAPAALRLYVGGSTPIAVSSVGDSRIYGSVFAPTATLEHVGDLEVVGAVLVGDVDGTGALRILHDRVADPDSPECQEPAPEEPPSESPPM